MNTNELFTLVDDFVVRLEDEGVPFQEVCSVMADYLELARELGGYEGLY